MNPRRRLSARALAATGALAATAALAAGALAPAASAAAARHGAGQASRPGLTAARGWRRCTIGELSAGLHPQQPRTQEYGFILTLTNTSGRPCTVDGYPGLGLENARHRVLRSHTTWGRTPFDRDPGRRLLVLSPGETASADVGWRQAPARHTGVRATFLEVTPPNDYSHFVLRIPGGPHEIYRGDLAATAMARHTPF